MPDITYNLNIPSAENSPSVDQPNMKINTNAVNSLMNVDHYGFKIADGGFHKKSTYPILASDPGSPLTSLVQYTKTEAGSTELFIQRDSIATPIQLTAGLITAAANGSTFLAGGIILKWGTVALAGASGGVVFGTAFPANIFSISMNALTTAPATNGILGYSANTVAGFTVHQNGGAALTVSWIAIGN